MYYSTQVLPGDEGYKQQLQPIVVVVLQVDSLIQMRLDELTEVLCTS